MLADLGNIDIKSYSCYQTALCPKTKFLFYLKKIKEKQNNNLKLLLSITPNKGKTLYDTALYYLNVYDFQDNYLNYLIS